MSDKNLIVYLVVFGALGGIFSALGVYAVYAVSGTRASGQGRALAGGLTGLAFGLILGVVVEVVLAEMFKFRRELGIAAYVSTALGALAGASGGVLRGAAGGVIAGLLFANLVVTTHVELLARLVASIGGIVVGVWVSAVYEKENPIETPEQDERDSSESEEVQLPEVRFACNQCGRRLKAKGQDVGRLTQCSKCGLRMQIPGFRSGPSNRSEVKNTPLELD